MYVIGLYMTFNGSMCSTMLRQYTEATFVTRLLSPREMAQQSGWPEGRIRRLISTRRLRHMKIDGLILLPETAIEEFTAAHMVEPEAVSPSH